jgi:hypothetical protein
MAQEDGAHHAYSGDPHFDGHEQACGSRWTHREQLPWAEVEGFEDGRA